MGVSFDLGYFFSGPNNKDYSILGSILGSPYFGKLPYKLTSGSGSSEILYLEIPTFQNVRLNYPPPNPK